MALLKINNDEMHDSKKQKVLYPVIKNNFINIFKVFPTYFKRLEGFLIEGVIVAIKDSLLIVNLGLKMTVKYPLNKFQELKNVKVGETIPFIIEELETLDGEILLNNEKALKQMKHQNIWNIIKKNKKNINGIVLNHVEGGFSVGLGGIVAFLPKDQIFPIKYKNKSKKIDKHSFVGSLKTFHILNINTSNFKKNVILSRTEALKDMIYSIKRKELEDMHFKTKR